MKFKSFKFFLVVLFLFVLSQHSFAKDSDINLLTKNNWNCVYAKNMIDVGHVSINKNIQYDKNGTLKCNGDIIFSIVLPNGKKDKIMYYYTNSGQWSIKDGQLVETVSNVEVVNMTHPDIKENVNAKSFLTTNIDNFSEIIEISNINMKLIKVKSGDIIFCKAK